MGEDVIIIGAGPAGISAAIQLKRHGLEPMLLEKEDVGGLLRNAHWIENYPGFPEGISGLKLAKIFKRQLENAGVKVRYEEVLELDHRKKMFYVKTNRRVMTSNLIVIASGTKPRKLCFPSISADVEKHIFYEIHPLAQVANEKIAIIGSGDIAFDYALNLSSKGNEVIILNRGKKLKCIPLLWRRATNTQKIRYRENTQIKNIQCHDHGLMLTCDNTSGESEFLVRYLVVAIGREPNLDFLSENVKRNLEKLQNVKTLHMIGDVKNEIYRQTAICVGDGVKTAMEVYRKMTGEKLCE